MILTDQTIQKLTKLLKDNDYLLLGEMHGVKENALLVEELVNKIHSIKTVGLEYPKEIESSLNQIPIPSKELLEYPPVQTMLKDGRFSQTHLNTIDQLVKQGIRVICFDPKTSAQDWNERDKGMAEIVMSYREKMDKKDKILLICGNMHAKFKEFDMESLVEKGKIYHHVPFGSYLEKQTNVRLNYLSGQFYNFGTKDFLKTEAHRDQLWEQNGQLFLDIEKASPTQN